MEMEGMEIEEEQMRFKKIDKKVGKGSEGKCREVTHSHSQKKNDGELRMGEAKGEISLFFLSFRKRSQLEKSEMSYGWDVCMYV